jgi:glucokinase
MAQSGDWRSDLGQLIEDARSLLAEVGAGGAGPLEAVGVSVPGPADPSRGLLLNPPNLAGWRDVPIGAVLREAFGVEVRIENDANAAGLAESHFGAGRGVRDLLYLTTSTGVGSGVISGGRLVRGAFGAAGEAGHLPIEFPGIQCACGLRGCLEAYVGGSAWAARLREIVPEDSRVLALADGQREVVGPEQLVTAAREGDAFARAEFARWLEHLARGIVSLVMVLDPQRIVLGTIAVAAGEALCFDPLRARVAERLWPHQAQRLEIVPAALGPELPKLAGLTVARFGTPMRAGDELSGRPSSAIEEQAPSS